MRMPTKNTVKELVSDTYYHIYNRGWNRNKVFRDAADYTFFEQLLMRAFAPEPTEDSRGRAYKNFYDNLHLNAYCLMGNHFHLLVYQKADEKTLSVAMKSILTSYSMYFNKKYKQRGSVFESTYKAVRTVNDSQLIHITRYIHLNHRKYAVWLRSSYQDYINGRCRSWIDASPILELFPTSDKYVEFVSDYEAMQRERDDLKHEMANS
jgi:putative transposase